MTKEFDFFTDDFLHDLATDINDKRLPVAKEKFKQLVMQYWTDVHRQVFGDKQPTEAQALAFFKEAVNEITDMLSGEKMKMTKDELWALHEKISHEAGIKPPFDMTPEKLIAGMQKHGAFEGKTGFRLENKKWVKGYYYTLDFEQMSNIDFGKLMLEDHE
jgi:aldehyde:ferredoxin oxidoreductase